MEDAEYLLDRPLKGCISEAHPPSLISVDCSSTLDSTSMTSVSIGTVEESTIFKRRLQRAPRRRPNHSLDIDSITRLYSRQSCDCEGACGCARPISVDLKRNIHSSWSPSYILEALDIYFDKLEKGTISRLQEDHTPMILKSGLSLSVSLSADNLKDIV